LPTGRAGQLLALAILCLVLGGVYLLLVSPILDLYSQREATLADRRMLAPRLSAAAAVLPELRARLAELQASATTRNIALDYRAGVGLEIAHELIVLATSLERWEAEFLVQIHGLRHRADAERVGSQLVERHRKSSLARIAA
jgi:hypothetical protein